MARARTPRTRRRGKKADFLDHLRRMMLIRRFEEKAAEMYARGRIAGFRHLYIGQEAIAVGAMACVGPEDYIITH